MKEYKKRIADSILEDKLEAMGAVLIEGAKYCGKTTLASQHASSILYMADPETKEQNLAISNTNISLLLKGKTPRLIDEWQIAPKLWDAVRNEIDKRGEEGQFILTGSSVPVSTEDIYHSGTGRFGWLKLRTMSLWESGESSGDVSLHSLFEGEKDVSAINELDLSDIAFLICRGGWPSASLKTNQKAALIQATEYYEAVVRFDVSRADNVERNPENVRRFMRSYARNQGTQVSAQLLLEDLLVNESDTISINTIYSYIGALQKIFVIEDCAAWNPNLRSKTSIRTADTRYFTDPSIGTAALGLGPNDLINDLRTYGFLFEALCIRDLRVYADALGGNIYHYRDKSNLECDAVIHLRNGLYGLVEIKIGGSEAIESAAKTLKNLAEKIDYDRMKRPSFLMVLTAVGKYAYRRPEDDILVVPIGCLKN